MITVNSIGKLSSGFIVHYTVTAACGCSSSRYSLVIGQKTKPTDKQVKQAIEKHQNELKNK